MELNEQYLLYDENCPLCSWYTRIFVKFGFIQGESRLSYQKTVQNDEFTFDRERAKSEIAYLSGDSEPLYGIDSMLQVVGRKAPVIKAIGRFFIVYWFLQLLYRFISFNRKIIAPTTCKTECSCTPEFSLFWRIVFIAFCGSMTYLLVGSYFNMELSTFLYNDHFSYEFALFIGQLVFQAVVFKLLKQHDVFTYLGHVALISMFGALFLGGAEIILSMVQSFSLESGLLAPFFFGAVVCWMLIEHNRRVKLLGLSSWLTVSLILFRIVIYPIVFKF